METQQTPQNKNRHQQATHAIMIRVRHTTAQMCNASAGCQQRMAPRASVARTEQVPNSTDDVKVALHGQPTIAV